MMFMMIMKQYQLRRWSYHVYTGAQARVWYVVILFQIFMKGNTEKSYVHCFKVAL